MRCVIEKPPPTASESSIEMLHGMAVEDPYRWLEDQNCSRTRNWIDEQNRYARSYLDRIPGRDRIRQRIRELLDVERYEAVEKAGCCYFFRKRLPGQEQACLYLRKGNEGHDELLIDPSALGLGDYAALRMTRVAPSGGLFVYEIKQGGERSGTFHVFDVKSRQTLSEALPCGFLRGIVFAPDEKSFYYVHKPLDSSSRAECVVWHHVVGSPFEEDRPVFRHEDSGTARMCLVSDRTRIGILIYRFLDSMQTDFYLSKFEDLSDSVAVLTNADFGFAPQLAAGRLLALTDREAPNFRIVELRPRDGAETEWLTLVPESSNRIREWAVIGDRIYVSYHQPDPPRIAIFDLSGVSTGELAIPEGETVRLCGRAGASDELLFELESFTRPATIYGYSPQFPKPRVWARHIVPFCSEQFTYTRISYPSKDGTAIPMYLAMRRDAVSSPDRSVIMTSYGGHGIPMTPQFSVFVACLLELGCVLALPNIRGGSEFGASWHSQAKRKNRQIAFDDFLAAAEWLIRNGRTSPSKLAIFGGSNSGLLVGAALTQRPELFRAVLMMVPLLDMVRYHLFDQASAWKDEFGTAEDPEDFAALLSYSPYHRVEAGAHYPATMIVSGDLDGTCNPLHARKMTARLQQANASGSPIILDYSPFRGHSPVLPLRHRIDALTDRIAFLAEQLQLAV